MIVLLTAFFFFFFSYTISQNQPYGIIIDHVYQPSSVAKKDLDLLYSNGLKTTLFISPDPYGLLSKLGGDTFFEVMSVALRKIPIFVGGLNSNMKSKSKPIFYIAYIDMTYTILLGSEENLFGGAIGEGFRFEIRLRVDPPLTSGNPNGNPFF